jgi:hypothetical protein
VRADLEGRLRKELGIGPTVAAGSAVSPTEEAMAGAAAAGANGVAERPERARR